MIRSFHAEYQRFRTELLSKALYTDDQLIGLFSIYRAEQRHNGTSESATVEPEKGRRWITFKPTSENPVKVPASVTGRGLL